AGLVRRAGRVVRGQIGAREAQGAVLGDRLRVVAGRGGVVHLGDGDVDVDGSGLEVRSPVRGAVVLDRVVELRRTVEVGVRRVADGAGDARDRAVRLTRDRVDGDDGQRLAGLVRRAGRVVRG